MNISIIIRTMGRASLRETVASVAAQGRDDVEIVVVDAAGTLSPPELQGVASRFVSRGVTLPRSTAAQAGLDAVQTRWALFLDDDDLLLPGHLDKLATALQQSPDAVLAHAGVEMRRPSSDEVLGRWDEPFEAWELLLANRIPIHAALFDVARARSASVRFDPGLDLFEDWDFWLQLAGAGPFVHCPGVSALYLLHDEAAPARQTRYGDDSYWRIWHKWLAAAPAAWWSRAFEAGASARFVERRVRSLEASVELQRSVAQQHLGSATQLQGDLQQRSQELYDAQVRLGQTEHRLAQAEGSLGWTQQVLESTRSDLDQTHRALAGLQAELEAAREEQRSTLAALDAARQELAGRDMTLVEARLAVDAARLEIVQHEAARAEAIRALDAARVDAQRRQEALLAVRASLSWRVTAPLRSFGQQVAGWRARAAQLRRTGAWRRRASPRQATLAYEAWMRGPEVQDARRRHEELAQTPSLLCISVIMPVYQPPRRWLDEAIDSVLAQTHARWELCIADDASPDPAVLPHLRAWAARDPRIRLIERPVNGHICAASNSALALAGGDWIVLLDQDDRLAPTALAEVADAVARHPQAGIVYSDEDKLDATGARFEPYFKPAFNLELLRGQNVVSHLGAYRRSLVAEVGGFREGFEGSQDHDLALRCAERLAAAQVVHVPRVLYHWRVSDGSTAAGGGAKPYAAHAGLRAVNDHLARTAPGSQAEPIGAFGFFRVRHPLPPTLPRVQVFVEGTDAAVPAWIESLREATDYPDFDVHRLAGDARGLSAVAADAAPGAAPLLLCLQAGLMPRHPGWLHEMVSHALRDRVGVVGGRIDSADAALIDGALIGDGLVAWQGTPAGRGGYFGRPLLAQAVSAISASMLLFRRELLPLCRDVASTDRRSAGWQFCEAARRAGWRIVWTPFATAVQPGPSAAPAGEAGPPQADGIAFNPNLEVRGGRWVPSAMAGPLGTRPGA